MSLQTTCHATLRGVLCKNQTKWEIKNFEPTTQIYMEVGPHEGCSKMSIIEVITQQFVGETLSHFLMDSLQQTFQLLNL